MSHYVQNIIILKRLFIIMSTTGMLTHIESTKVHSDYLVKPCVYKAKIMGYNCNTALI